jgi:hypothetical protein
MLLGGVCLIGWITVGGYGRRLAERVWEGAPEPAGGDMLGDFFDQAPGALGLRPAPKVAAP